jgi:preprotein translocase subunit SecA
LKTGLGIGIDYGKVKLVTVNNEPTILGVPVIYAYRLSNAPSNHTYINQSVYKNLNTKYAKLIETITDIKNTGDAIVYDLIDFEKNENNELDWYEANQTVA